MQNAECRMELAGCVSVGEPVGQDTPSASAATPLKEGNNRMRQSRNYE